MGNLSLIILIGLSSHLHTPMYFFLFNLSFIDLCYSSVFTPKMLINIISEKKTISYMGCMTQLYFLCFFGISESYVLTSMAYDRYVAIYNPLLYSVSMAPRVYMPLSIASHVGGILHASVHTVATFSLSFCASSEIRHVFCDIPPLLAICCSDTHSFCSSPLWALLRWSLS